MRYIGLFVALVVVICPRPSSQQNCRVFADCDGVTADRISLNDGRVGPPGKRGAQGIPGPKGESGLGVNVTALKEQLQPDNGPKIHYLTNTLTWSFGRSYCRNIGKTLCSFDQICLPKSEGRMLVIDVIPGDHWVPVSNSYNNWVEIGDHHYHPCILHNARWGAPNWGTSTTAVAHKGTVFCCESAQRDDAPLSGIAYQYIGKSLTYDSSNEHCESQGRRLCYSSEICQQAKPRFGTIKGDMWVAMKDRRNDWIQIGNSPHNPCKQHGVHGGLPSWGTRTGGSLLTYVGYVFCCAAGAK